MWIWIIVIAVVIGAIIGLIGSGKAEGLFEGAFAGGCLAGHCLFELLITGLSLWLVWKLFTWIF